jgi:predicted methyltransferase
MLISPFLYEGMIAVDCTVGNGHDTLFLAQQAGKSGRVYGFDVQSSALESTKERLGADQSDKAQVTLFHMGHEHLEDQIKEPVDIIMYNLGYLPRHDKHVTTMTETTLESVRQAMSLIKTGGVVSIIAYPGHDEGAKELGRLDILLKEIDQKAFDVLRSEFINQVNRPPILFLIEKR